MYFMMLKSKWKGLKSLVLIISEREMHVEKTALGLLKRATNIKGGIRRKQLALWAKPESIIKIVQN